MSLGGRCCLHGARDECAPGQVDSWVAEDRTLHWGRWLTGLVVLACL